MLNEYSIKIICVWLKLSMNIVIFYTYNGNNRSINLSWNILNIYRTKYYKYICYIYSTERLYFLYSLLTSNLTHTLRTVNYILMFKLILPSIPIIIDFVLLCICNKCYILLYNRLETSFFYYSTYFLVFLDLVSG